MGHRQTNGILRIRKSSKNKFEVWVVCGDIHAHNFNIKNQSLHWLTAQMNIERMNPRWKMNWI